MFLLNRYYKINFVVYSELRRNEISTKDITYVDSNQITYPRHSSLHHPKLRHFRPNKDIILVSYNVSKMPIVSFNKEPISLCETSLSSERSTFSNFDKTLLFLHFYSLRLACNNSRLFYIFQRVCLI